MWLNRHVHLRFSRFFFQTAFLIFASHPTRTRRELWMALTTSADCRKRLAQLLKVDGNTVCADCREPDPTWASTNQGTFICTQCAGVHRSLGVQDSFVLSCTLDDWTEQQVDHMAAYGNTRVNQELEFCVPKAIEVPYLSRTDRDTREYFIKAKYVQQLFKAAPGKSPRAPERVVRKGSNPSSNGKSRTMSAMIEYIGIVTVQLVEGKNLIIKDLMTSDPYCVLTLGLQTRKSKIKYKTLSPTYHETFNFSWNGVDQLVVEVFDKDELTKDDHMGKLELQLDPLLRESGAIMKDWFTIRHRKHKEREQGELLLEITFMKIQ